MLQLFWCLSHHQVRTSLAVTNKVMDLRSNLQAVALTQRDSQWAIEIKGSNTLACM